MKKICLGLLLAISVANAAAQKLYFIYIQSEANQPFYVKMKEKVLSSSSSGYIILSKLTDTTQSFSIGFPKNSMQFYFSVAMNKKDHGFLLKNLGEKGWGLFDRQSLAMLAGSTTAAGVPEIKTEVKKDASPFTESLSKASDDPSLKEKPVRIFEEKKPVKVNEVPSVVVTEKPIEKELPKVDVPKVEQPIVVKEDPKTPEVKTDPVPVQVKEEPKPVVVVKEVPIVTEENTMLVTKEEYGKSVVRKRSESSTTEGFGLVFIDSLPNGSSDTIRLLIPEPKTMAGVKEELPKEERKFLEVTSEPVQIETKITPVTKEEKPKEAVPVIPVVNETEKPVLKNNCKLLAVDANFFQLRKVMAAAETDDDMIYEARKACKTKCFSVTQIKNLSVMFLSDEGKYKFFDAVYNCSSDPENYPSLQAELKDEYFIKRFRAMLRN